MNGQAEQRKGISLRQVLMIVAGTMLLTIVAMVVVIKIWLFPSPFTPVELSQKEEQQLEKKLDQLDSVAAPSRSVPYEQRRDDAVRQPPASGQQGDRQGDFDDQGTLRPEAYSEEGATREITFSERELNALLANNTDLAQKMAIDLAQDLVSLRLLLPLDPDFPVMGGKTLRVRAGVELAYRDSRPVMILKGVSLMGVPLPNAWLGGLKNIDIMQEFGGQPGFWQSLGEGLDSIRVREGELYIRLKE
ncbi:MAG: arginine N-succinyltransferase [Candidatus Electrothrix sp. YB6]